MKSENVIENEYLEQTLNLVDKKLNRLNNDSKKLESVFAENNGEYFDYLKANANKMNQDDVIEILNLQGKLDDIQEDSIDSARMKDVYSRMKDKPYFAGIRIKENIQSDEEKYYIGIHSLVDDNRNYRVVDWRSPIASIFYDYEQGDCKIVTNSSILNCQLISKRQYGISGGKLNYFFDSTINIEDEILKDALAQNATSKMKSIVQTIQKEQNAVIRGDENKTLIVQGVAGSGKTAIALHRIAYLIYKMKGKITSNNIMFLSPNNAFSSYISSVLPELAEDDVEKLQLDIFARKCLKKHLIMEGRYEQVERLISTNNWDEYKYKTSISFLNDLITYAYRNYIDNFHLDSLVIKDVVIDVNKVHSLFFDRYADRELFTRLKWITDNIFDSYFFKYKKIETQIKIKELIFSKLYASIQNKNCVRAYMNFLQSKGMKLELVGNKVRNEDVYGILFFKMFIYGLDKFDNVKHLLIDEMQDYSPVQMYILNYLFDCPKTVLGDYNQSLDISLARENFKEIPNILNGDCEVIKLGKSYRSTMQIADFYNFIGNRDKADVVSRQGEDVDFVCVNRNNLISTITHLIGNYQDLGYNSIGLITRDNLQARKIYSLLPEGSNINLIDDNIDGYDNKACIISAFNSKGLEFDAVIVLDSYENYKTDIDRNIMYVASTRALHRLTILSVDEESELITKYKERI